jgi:twitching motility protein PilT
MDAMDLASLVARAAAEGASDLHLQSGRPVALRVAGTLRTVGEPLPAAEVDVMVATLLGKEGLADFRERGSADLAVDLAGSRCRVNVLATARGSGLAVRLLSNDLVTLDTLNLHPDLKDLAGQPHGLVLVTGPTGCGKSSTLAALVQEVNLSRTAHVITLEQPIEYDLLPIRAYIRQREVGRDTPSFAQGLLDATREDIDVLMVGEMRDRETMRLVLDAAETGHLVLATLHSSSPAEALQRIVSAFPALEQPSVCAQLADVILGVVTQRLAWLEGPGLRVPECEILRGSLAVKSVLRKGELFRLQTAMETGGRDGNWTLARYRSWLDARSDFHVRDGSPVPTTPHGTGPEAQGDDGRWVIDPADDSVADVLDELDER